MYLYHFDSNSLERLEVPGYTKDEDTVIRNITGTTKYINVCVTSGIDNDFRSTNHFYNESGELALKSNNVFWSGKILYVYFLHPLSFG